MELQGETTFDIAFGEINLIEIEHELALEYILFYTVF